MNFEQKLFPFKSQLIFFEVRSKNLTFRRFFQNIQSKNIIIKIEENNLFKKLNFKWNGLFKG